MSLLSIATAEGPASPILVAGLPSRVVPPELLPLPATVVIIFVCASTRRIRPLRVSAIKRLPLESKSIPEGDCKPALLANPPSPLKVALPLPTTVVIVFVLASIRRTRLFVLINRLPARSNNKPLGTSPNPAFVAKAPSPLKERSLLPAIVVITLVTASTRLMLCVNLSLIKILPLVSTVIASGSILAILEITPSFSELPPPAIVLITPVSTSMRRTRPVSPSAIKIFPRLSRVTLVLVLRLASSALPPSPEKESPPAIVVISSKAKSEAGLAIIFNSLWANPPRVSNEKVLIPAKGCGGTLNLISVALIT
ncbi:MAG: hypothetical protein FD167_124 [bacterium]|nr:MAG: hypothetical protein FD167_124 [bacterium]